MFIAIFLVPLVISHVTLAKFLLFINVFTKPLHISVRHYSPNVTLFKLQTVSLKNALSAYKLTNITEVFKILPESLNVEELNEIRGPQVGGKHHAIRRFLILLVRIGSNF